MLRVLSMSKGLIRRGNVIVLYFAHKHNVLRTIVFPLLVRPLFPSFLIQLPSSPIYHQLSHREYFKAGLKAHGGYTHQDFLPMNTKVVN